MVDIVTRSSLDRPLTHEEMDSNLLEIFTKSEVAEGVEPAKPQLRVSRSNQLLLSADWQTLVFSENPGFDSNSFPNNATLYNTTTEGIQFNHSEFRRYEYEIDLQLIYNVSAVIDYRFEVVNSANELITRFPDAGQSEYATLGTYIDLAIRSAMNERLSRTVYGGFGASHKLQLRSHCPPLTAVEDFPVVKTAQWFCFK